MYIRTIQTLDELFCFIHQISLRQLKSLKDDIMGPRQRNLFDEKKYIVGYTLLVRDLREIDQHLRLFKIKKIETKENKRTWEKQKIVISNQYDDQYSMNDLLCYIDVFRPLHNSSKFGWMITDKEIYMQLQKMSWDEKNIVSWSNRHDVKNGDRGFFATSISDFSKTNGIDYYDDCIDHINDNNAYCFNASGRSFPFFIPFDKLKSQL